MLCASIILDAERIKIPHEDPIENAIKADKKKGNVGKNCGGISVDIKIFDIIIAVSKSLVMSANDHAILILS